MTREKTTALIFDLDGTLLNTLSSIAASYNRALTSLSHKTHSVDAYRYFIGNGARMCATRCLEKEHRTSTTIDQLYEKQQQDYALSWHQKVEIYPGITQLLERLNKQNIPIAVLSNKDHEFTQRCVKHFFPAIDFAQVLGHGPDTPHKPDPTGALYIAKKMGRDPKEIALIGDTAMDIETAIDSGMMAIGALWGFRTRDELVDAGAMQLIKHPEEINSILI